MCVQPAVPLCLVLVLSATVTARGGDAAAAEGAGLAALIPEGARLEKLAGDMKFTEGPVWVPGERGGMLLFSDIPADRILRWTAAEGVGVFRSPSRGANGNTLDPEGRLVTCEHRSRSVVRNSFDGSMETLADSHRGAKLNSPNDAAVRSDGTIFFTDPPYGLDRRQKEQRGNYVYRLDPRTKRADAVVTEIAWPNGICFSPDESRLYVANSDLANPVIYSMPFNKDGTPGTPVPLCRVDKGVPDGIRCDADGRVWSSAGDGVQVFAPDGKLIGKIPVPESPANLCFGGEEGKTLFITARTSLYAIRTNVMGAAAKGANPPAAPDAPVAPDAPDTDETSR